MPPTYNHEILAGFALAAVAWALLGAVFVTELVGRYSPRHTWLRRFPAVLILAAELTKFRCSSTAYVAQTPACKQAWN